MDETRHLPCKKYDVATKMRMSGRNYCFQVEEQFPKGDLEYLDEEFTSLARRLVLIFNATTPRIVILHFIGATLLFVFCLCRNIIRKPAQYITAFADDLSDRIYPKYRIT